MRDWGGIKMYAHYAPSSSYRHTSALEEKQEEIINTSAVMLESICITPHSGTGCGQGTSDAVKKIRLRMLVCII